MNLQIVRRFLRGMVGEGKGQSNCNRLKNCSNGCKKSDRGVESSRNSRGREDKKTAKHFRKTFKSKSLVPTLRAIEL